MATPLWTCPDCGGQTSSEEVARRHPRYCPKGTGLTPRPQQMSVTGRVDTASIAAAVETMPSKLEQAPVVPTATQEPVCAPEPQAPAPGTFQVNGVQTELPPLTTPPREPNFYIDRLDLDMLQRVASRSDRGEIINVMIRGPRGSGKTTLSRECAAIWLRPFYEVNCGTLVEPEQWFGKDRLTKGETWFRMARFIQAIETSRAVILLDEVNRPHPEVLNALFGLLDWRRSLWIDDLQREVKVAPGVVFFGTMNEGDEYIVNPLDAALRERFGRAVETKPPPKHEVVSILAKRTGIDQDNSTKLAELMVRVNRNRNANYFVSIRQLLVAAEEVKDGASFRDSIMTSIVNHAVDFAVKKEILLVVQDLGINVADIIGDLDGNSKGDSNA